MSPMFVPGPVDVNEAVLAAQAQAMLPHRSPEFEELYADVADNVRKLFSTRQRVYLVASSGTGLQEAAVRNLARKDVLSCVNGAFSDRWHVVAQSNGKSADRLEMPWEQPISADRVYEALKLKSYEVLTVVHNETSTGLQNPVGEIAAAARQASPETLICVDAVSSLGGVKIDMDGWGLDVVLSSSQKCLGLPPGLSLGAVSDRALERARNVPDRGWYFDFLRLERHRLNDSTPATPPMPLIYALRVQLDRIWEEGLENRFARHCAMAERVQGWVLERGLGLFAPDGFRSTTVTAVINHLELEFDKLNAYLMKKNMRIANGYGGLKGRTFRIAHMGDTQMREIQKLLQALDDYIDNRAA